VSTIPRHEIWKRRKADCIEAYNEAKGDRAEYRSLLRKKYGPRNYALDLMTIMILIKIAIEIYEWAKDNGYLSAIGPQDALTCPNFGEDEHQFAMECQTDA